ncbi:MAG TPA: exodeoxyribonuclease VII large subunit, partial [Geobacteraceae bacterium]|nr:exodeoxyribonuclease VII large subunit [Geobacteraceae bacterium]
SAAMEKAMLRIIDASREAAAVNAARLSALSPLATLERGYSIARHLPAGEIIRDSRRLCRGDRIGLTFRRGSACCVVESSEEESVSSSLTGMADSV